MFLFKNMREALKIKKEIKMLKKQRELDNERTLTAIAEEKNKRYLNKQREQINCNHDYKLVYTDKEVERGLTYFLTVESITHTKYYLQCNKCGKDEFTYSEAKKNKLLYSSSMF